MRPNERRESGQNDMFRSRLDRTVNMQYELVLLRRNDRLALFGAGLWRGLYRKVGRPPLPTRLAILKHLHNLLDGI